MNEQNLNQFLAAARQYFFDRLPGNSSISDIASCQAL